MIEICISPTAAHQKDAADVLLAGFRRHGVKAEITHRLQDYRGDTLVCWGWRKGRRLQQQAPGRPVLVMEHGYVGDRWQWLSLGWDGLNGHARFPFVEDGGERWRQHFSGVLQPVKTAGDYHVLLGQVRGDMSLEGSGNFERWYQRTHSLLSSHNRLPVYFRPHPVDVQRYGTERASLGLPVVAGSLSKVLQGAAGAWAYNSNSLVDAALAGVPVLAFNPGAMVWPISGRDLAPALDPEQREHWAHRLAWCQWTRDEMRSGAAWEAVQAAKPADAPTWASLREELYAAA